MIVVCEKILILIVCMFAITIAFSFLDEESVDDLETTEVVFEESDESIVTSFSDCDLSPRCLRVPICGKSEKDDDNITALPLLLHNSEDWTIYADNINKDYYSHTPIDCMKRYENNHAIIRTSSFNSCEFYIDGSMMEYNSERIFENDSYCFNTINTTDHVNDFVICAWYIVPNSDMRLLYALSSCIIISIPIFLITFTIHATSSKARLMFKLALCGYCGSSLVFYIFYAFDIVNWTVWLNKHRTSNYSRQFSDEGDYQTTFEECSAWIATFMNTVSNFYVNVMSFDIWWTFRKCLPSQKRGKTSERIKIWISSIYVWTIPTIINLCIFFKKCKPEVENIIVMVLAGCNTIFFIATVWNIVKVRREIASHCNNVEGQHHNKNRKSLMVYLKLFVLTAVGLGLNNVGFFVLDQVEVVDDALEIGIICAVAVQAPIIFLCFVWKDKATRHFWLNLKKLTRRLINWIYCKHGVEKTNKNNPGQNYSTTIEESCSEQCSK